jgi:hypothetical protein
MTEIKYIKRFFLYAFLVLFTLWCIGAIYIMATDAFPMREGEWYYGNPVAYIALPILIGFKLIVYILFP